MTPPRTSLASTATPLQVLVVDDNPGDRDLVAAQLEVVGRLELSFAASLAGACHHLGSRRTDIVLLDLGLPDSQGLATYDTLHRQAPTVPVVVVTGLDDDGVGVDALKGGAQDYLVKGRTSADALARALRYAVERHRLQSQLERERNERARLATLGTLAASIAHEINNPLSFVLYNIESLAKDIPRLAQVVATCAAASRAGPPCFDLRVLEDVTARFRDAIEGAARIKEIVRGLSTFSHVDQTTVAPIDIRLAAEHALAMAMNEIKYRARLVKDFREVPMVLASDGKLAQVFLNLLINAAHAIVEGHVADNEIRLRTWAEGDDVFAEIRDTGRGIARDDQDLIFEPFFTTKEAGVGTGLGLSICKAIVEGFRGEISFTSEPGIGTRFLIRLPRVPPTYAPTLDPPCDSANPERRVRGRILVVDDEEAIRRSLARLLTAEHDVVTAASGEEGKAVLQRDHGFDVIFCDLMMPKVSGMELHAWIAAMDPELADHVVFVTGGVFTPGASEYLAKVGNLRLEKPFETSVLRRIACDRVRAARAKAKA